MSKFMTRVFASRREAIAVIAVLALVLAGVVTVVVVRASAVAPTSIWGDGKPPAVHLQTSERAMDLGTTFVPTVDGQVTALRFYKLPGESGSHTGSIWAPTGDRIATAAFASETSSGWQVATLSSPIDLTAGTSYVVSYSVGGGSRYATTEKFSGTSRTSALRVPHRNSGVFGFVKQASSPRSSWQSSQYWADLTFVPSGSHSTARPTSNASGSPTASAWPAASASPTDSPSPSATATSSPTAAPGSGGAPAGGSSPSGGFPTRTSAGLPAGWSPVTQMTGDLHVRTAGAVVKDLKITDGTIFIEAPNVTLNRIQGVGAFVQNGSSSSCSTNLLIENSTFVPNGSTSDRDDPVIQYGGYTAKNIVIDGAPEGLRVSDGGVNCGPVAVMDSFIRVVSPTVCTDWHGDGIQGYGGRKITVRNTTILMQVKNNCYGTAPFFYPYGQGNTSVDIDGLLLGGSSGYPFREGMPGTVKNLDVISGSWVYHPVDVNCAVVSSWQAQVVTLDGAGQPVPTGTSIDCTGSGN